MHVHVNSPKYAYKLELAVEFLIKARDLRKKKLGPLVPKVPGPLLGGGLPILPPPAVTSTCLAPPSCHLILTSPVHRAAATSQFPSWI